LGAIQQQLTQQSIGQALEMDRLAKETGVVGGDKIN
jgi:hypothetical protein